MQMKTVAFFLEFIKCEKAGLFRCYLLPCPESIDAKKLIAMIIVDHLSMVLQFVEPKRDVYERK